MTEWDQVGNNMQPVCHKAAINWYKPGKTANLLPSIFTIHIKKKFILTIYGVNKYLEIAPQIVI